MKGDKKTSINEKTFKKRARQLDSSYTANYESPVKFKSIYDAYDVNKLENTLDIHKYISVLHDICLDYIYTSSFVEKGKEEKVKGIRSGLIKLMTTRGDDVKKMYSHKESEGWTMLMFSFVTLSSLECFMGEDFITEYSRIARDMPIMYSVDPTRSINEKKLKNFISIRRGGKEGCMLYATVPPRKKIILLSSVPSFAFISLHPLPPPSPLCCTFF